MPTGRPAGNGGAWTPVLSLASFPMPRIFDVTVPLSAEVPVYPGDPPFSLEPTHEIGKGAPYNLGRLSLGTQTGTHVDAPYHFLADGATVDQLPLEILLGKARVIELMGRDRVDRPDLEQLNLRDDLRVLFKTRMAGQMRHSQFVEDHVYLTEDAATYLSRHGIHAEIIARDSDGPVSDAVLERAKQLGAGYVVMGAFGHSRAVEAIFGGVTNAMLRDSDLPLVLAH